MGLFTKKPGGTAVGNFLRGIGGAILPGILGTGANRIEIGQTKTNAELARDIMTQQQAFDMSNAQVGAGAGIANALGNALGTLSPNSGGGVGGSISLGFVAMLVGLAVGIKYLFFPKKKGFKRR